MTLAEKAAALRGMGLRLDFRDPDVQPGVPGSYMIHAPKPTKGDPATRWVIVGDNLTELIDSACRVWFEW